MADSIAEVLSVERLAKRFGETVALDDVSMEFRPGTVHTILGENGSGKSTLVKLLSGVLAPDSGRVRVAGIDLHPVRPARARELGVATVFQEILVAPNRSVADNVVLGQDSLWKHSRPRREQVAAMAATLQELSDTPFDMSATVGNLGLVQRHQVAMARALVLDPAVLILDESTAALDVDDRERLFAAVRRRLKSGTAVVFITHRLEEVLELSDQVTVLRSGNKIAELGRSELTAKKLLALLNPEVAAEASS